MTESTLLCREQLTVAIYPELRRLARSLMRTERPNHTLQPTAIVHEALLKLLGMKRLRIQGPEHFFSLVVTEMRRQLTTHARARLALKRRAPETGFPETATSLNSPDLIAAVDDALNALAAIDPRAAQIVKLRFFCGLSLQETAAVLDLSARTVQRDWEFARTWLYGELLPG